MQFFCTFDKCADFLHISLVLILMADVVESRQQPGEILSQALRELVKATNRKHRKAIASPLTVTLGDEFQGLIPSLPGAVAILHTLETHRRAAIGECAYELRYVLHEGEIDSPINRQRAHNMVGPGLTRAREMLNDKFRGKPRYSIDIHPPELSQALGEAFLAMEAIEERWDPADFPVIETLLKEGDDEAAGDRLGRYRTSVARRRHTLQIAAFQALQSLQRRLSNTNQETWKAT